MCVCVGMCTCMHVCVHTWVCACMGAGVYILHQLLVTKSKVTLKKKKNHTTKHPNLHSRWMGRWTDTQTSRPTDKQPHTCYETGSSQAHEDAGSAAMMYSVFQHHHLLTTHAQSYSVISPLPHEWLRLHRQVSKSIGVLRPVPQTGERRRLSNIKVDYLWGPIYKSPERLQRL